RQVDDVVRLGPGQRVDDVISAELNFAANTLEVDPDGAVRITVVRRARPVNEGPDDVSSSGYRAELTTVRFRATPDTATGRLTARASARPAGQAWGDRTVRELTGHGVDCAGVLRRPASRMGLYFLEYGAAPRPVRVLYDRRESALSRLVPDEVEWGLVRRAR